LTATLKWKLHAQPQTKAYSVRTKETRFDRALPEANFSERFSVFELAEVWKNRRYPA
jgi:hypothetical protein